MTARPTPRSERARPRFGALALSFATMSLLAVVVAPPTHAQSFTILYNFTGGADGGGPNGPLVRDTAGNFYGTTIAGGNLGCGTVFKLTPRGKETVLYSFDCLETGRFPTSGVVLSGHNLYGTTSMGGATGGDCSNRGCGVIYQVNITTGTETVLYAFTHGTDGATPYAGLVQDRRGELYGITFFGGGTGSGTIYQFNPRSRQLTALYEAESNDERSYASMVLAPDQRTVYGTTPAGGPAGWGTIFSQSLGTTGGHKVWYSFSGGSDGAVPWSPPTFGPDGILYGTAMAGGVGYGVLYQFDLRTGVVSVLYTFNGDDGDSPEAAVVVDPSSGKMYGTTLGGDLPGNVGAIFEFDPGNRSENVLFHFNNLAGAYPSTALIEDSKGCLYGVAGGGLYISGVVFGLCP